MIFIYQIILFILFIAALEAKKWPLKLVLILLLFAFLRFIFLAESRKSLLVQKYFLGAIVKGDVSGVKNLLEKGVYVDLIIHDGLTPLICACMCGKKDIINLLIQNGAYVNAKNTKDGASSLHYACCTKGSSSIIQLLIEKGAKINLKSNQGVTPLHCAAPYGQIETAKLLFAKGANVHDKDIMGRTVLHRAAQRGYKQLVKLFLSKGSYVDQKDMYGNSPLFYACASNQLHIADILIQSGASFIGRSDDLLDPVLVDDVKKRISLFYSKN